MRFQLITETIEENLKVALQMDEFRDLSDPYSKMANENLEYYLDCAAALERGEKQIVCKSEYHKGYRLNKMKGQNYVQSNGS